MGIERQVEEHSKHFESAHVCPQCGTLILLEDFGLHETTTGIVSCPQCGRAGKIEIQIVRIDSTD